MEAVPYTKRLTGRVVAVSPGVFRRVEVELPDGAHVESEVLFTGGGSFREQGTITFNSGSDLHFRTLGTGSLVPSPTPGVRHGTVT